jgi:hypothetical protein
MKINMYSGIVLALKNHNKCMHVVTRELRFIC